MIDTNIYLTSRRFYWYNRSEIDNKNSFIHKDCYAFTAEWFTNAQFVKPELEFVPQYKKEEIFGKSHLVDYFTDFSFTNITDNEKRILDKILNETEEFFEEVNAGKIKPSKTLSCRIGEYAIVYDGELGNSIVVINDSKFLTPMKNLMDNLIEECSSDNDKLELYFNPKNETVYLAWKWNCNEEKGINWVGGIKPCQINSLTNIKTIFSEDLNILSNKKHYKFKNKEAK